MSDKRLKTDIKPSRGAATKALSGLKPYTYRYKGTDEKQIGIMAQDLEKVPELRGAVIRASDGKKVVDMGKLVPTILASNLELHSRIKKLERGE